MNPLLKLSFFLSLITLSHLQTTDYDCYAFAVQWMSKYIWVSFTFLNNIPFFIDNCCVDDVCWEKLKQIPTNTLSIHGLWPSNTTGVYLPTCNEGEQIQITRQETELYDNLTKYWTSSKESYENFWTHEYNKHGYCYTARVGSDNPDDYFTYTLEMFHSLGFPDLFNRMFHYPQEKEIQIAHGEFVRVIDAMYPGAKYKLLCRLDATTGKRYVTEIYFYYDLEFNFTDVVFAPDERCGEKEDLLSFLFF